MKNVKKLRYILLALIVSFMFGCDSTRYHWEAAKSRDTISAYDEFLSQSPSSEFSEQAKKRIDELKEEAAWKLACEEHSISSFQRFLRQYPQSANAHVARGKIDDLQRAERARIKQERKKAERARIVEQMKERHKKESVDASRQYYDHYLERLREQGTEYEGYKYGGSWNGLSSGISIVARVDCVSASFAGWITPKELSDSEKKEAADYLKYQLSWNLITKETSPWQLLVVCGHRRADLGIMQMATVYTVVCAEIFLLDTERKLLVNYLTQGGKGEDIDSALKDLSDKLAKRLRGR